MKNVFIFLFASLFLFACKKASVIDPSSTTTTVALTGKWYLTVDSFKETYNTSKINQAYVTQYNRTDYMLFNSDGSGQETFGQTLDTYTFTISGNIITFNHPTQVQKTSIGTNVTVSAFTQQAYIRSVTANQLNIFYNDISTDSKGNVIVDYESVYMTK